VNELVQFLTYAAKVFALPRLLRGVRDDRSYPQIPTRPVLLSLLFGAILRVGSYLDLAGQTRKRRWRRLIHWKEPISHDTLEYVAERLDLADLRATLVAVNKQLKTQKALESSKIHGLLFLSLDANEHFHSRSRCCPNCCQRQLEQTDAAGLKRSFIQYYHRYVFAQINGPKLNVLLDLEPIRPGEGEAEAALRLLGRIRRLYGPRFFDAITVDAWYVQGPFLQAVEKLGWGWVVVLKQERLEVFQEARALNQGAKPGAVFQEEGRRRHVQLWEIKDLNFSAQYAPKVRVVHARETWRENKVVGGQKKSQPRESHWWWMASQKVLAGYPPQMIHQAGHRRWGIENKAFRELTQYYHLEHCYHHHPAAMLAQMLILLLGFNLFSAYAALHSQKIRRAQLTLQALAEGLREALQEDLPWDQWFASG
jgi:hypothetical protein